MVAEVRAFPVAAAKVNQEAVEILQESLARALAGELVSVAVIEHRAGAGGAVATSCSQSEHSYHQMVSGAARLLHALCAQPEDRG